MIEEQRNAHTAVYETNRQLECQRLELNQANQWADQAQREKVRSSGHLHLSNRFFQEYHVKKIAKRLGAYVGLVVKKLKGPDSSKLMESRSSRDGILHP